MADDHRFEDDREMSAFDHLLFRGEERPRSRSTLLSVFVLDRVPDPERLEQVMERATRTYLRMRQRVVVPAVPVGSPEWVVDPDFDLRYHLRRSVLPAPGDLATLLRSIEPVFAAQLDLARPLWEAHLLEGFEGDRAVLVLKGNHALTDGVGGVKLLGELFDLEREPEPQPMPPVPVPEDVTPIDLARRGLNRMPGRVVSMVERRTPQVLRTVAGAVRSPSAAVGEVRAVVESLGRLRSGAAVEPSPLLRRRSLGRRLAVHELPLDDLKRAAKAVGGTVNDAYLAGVGAALRRYHEELGLPVEAVPAAVPVSIRTDDDGAGGNRWTAVVVRLPVGEADVSARVALLRDGMAGAQDEPAAKVAELLMPLMRNAPSAVLEQMASAAGGTDVQASNIPGPPFPLYVAGTRVERFYGFGPLPGPAMMLVLVSYDGTCTITAHYDTASVTDPERFERCLREGFDEVVAAGSTGGSGT